MKISVVSPSFNQRDFIGRTIESVAAQDYPAKEHILIDGGSTDGSIELIESAAAEYPHVTAICEPDRGQADAINKGLAIAGGDVLAWLNTDDYYSDPGVFQAVAAFFADNPKADLVRGRGTRVDANDEKISQAWIHPPDAEFPRALQSALGLLQPSIFFRRAVFAAVGGLSEDYWSQLDYEYWIRVTKAGFRFELLDRELSRATVHADAKSTGSRLRQLNECLRMMRDHFGYVPAVWIHRFAEFFLTGLDRKVVKGVELDEVQSEEAVEIERELLGTLNGDERSRTILRRHGAESPYSETVAAMVSHGLDASGGRRTVITSFDSAYFRQGLNLIAALHRTSFGSCDQIIVYSLGLTERERATLAAIDRVVVRDYPEEAREFFPQYLDPKTRAYKACAIRSSEPLVGDGDLILWMDAGLAPVRDVGEIFDLIAENEFFITDHDDKPGWPFYDISFTNPVSQAAISMSNSDLLAPHLCSALLGYRRGGRYQHIVEEAYLISQDSEAVLHPKILPDDQKYKPSLSAEQLASRDRLLAADADVEGVDREELLGLFPHYGNRTQSIFSVLAHRAQAPVSSATRYRRSSERSSRAAAVNWAESALTTDSSSSRVIDDDGVKESVVTYHHRGTYNNLDGIRQRPTGDRLLIVGNGPSLKQISFDHLAGRAWLGMNAAYRYWERVGIHPTYYACFDEVVLDSHSEAIARMVADRVSLGISKFFLRASITERHPELAQDPAVLFLEDLQREHPDWFPDQAITTGSFSVLVGWWLGYRDLGLLGIDLNYVERLPGAEAEGRALRLTASPTSNPNYFFDDYQRRGDRYNPPNRHPGMHLRSWARIADLVAEFPMRVLNLNPDSGVRDFEFGDFRNYVAEADSRELLPQRLAHRVVQEDRERRFWRQRILDESARRPMQSPRDRIDGQPVRSGSATDASVEELVDRIAKADEELVAIVATAADQLAGHGARASTDAGPGGFPRSS